ncbi:UNVERIFIED_CONTAM: hypothetical protein Scaly_1837800 [Sesamum calycinum]|uniref:Uncharacterized protein n=1 Tax=Sesamum calycinum TaxID=2727403 RepID=A0AAW2NE38_9LAMI
MAMRTFYNEIKGMKVKELPTYLKPMFTIDYLKNSVKRGLDNYHAKYIETSSVDPLLSHLLWWDDLLLPRCLARGAPTPRASAATRRPLIRRRFRSPPTPPGLFISFP